MTIDELRGEIKSAGWKGWRITKARWNNQPVFSNCPRAATAYKTWPTGLSITLRGQPWDVWQEIYHIESDDD